MQIIRQNVNFDFIGKIKIAVTISCVLLMISLGSLVVEGGPRYGIDFAGGTLIQIKFSAGQVDIGEVRRAIQQLGDEQASVQPFGDRKENEYLIYTQTTTGDLEGLSGQVRAVFLEKFGQDSFEIRRVEMVGPKVGKDLREKGFLAVVCSLIGMLIYIWWRFEFRFGIGAIVALTHDVTIVLGALSLTRTSIDLPIIAALLTVVGYSVNDTIIVCDRIRENRRKLVRKDLRLIINTSINNTLSRTIITSGTTLLVVLALFIFGGGVIHDFAFTLLVGVIIGTYSSIFIASPVFILWEKLLHDKKRPATVKR